MSGLMEPETKSEIEVVKLTDLLKEIHGIASGADQVCEDDTEALGIIWNKINAVLYPDWKHSHSTTEGVE